MGGLLFGFAQIQTARILRGGAYFLGYGKPCNVGTHKRFNPRGTLAGSWADLSCTRLQGSRSGGFPVCVPPNPRMVRTHSLRSLCLRQATASRRMPRDPYAAPLVCGIDNSEIHAAIKKGDVSQVELCVAKVCGVTSSVGQLVIATPILLDRCPSLVTFSNRQID